MHQFQQDFIQFALESDVLRFGEFTLKSGRQSPWFFNAGLFNTGRMLSRLGEFYADAIVQSGIEYDVLFGPAYKGIPLVSSVAIALQNKHGIDKPWVFNRKEAKDHGEGGSLVGASMQGRVLVIDDVITAGTAIRESLVLIDQSNAELAGVCVSIDRQERGNGDQSAIQELEAQHNVTVLTIATLATIMDYLKNDPSMTNTLEEISQYRKEFGIIS